MRALGALGRHGDPASHGFLACDRDLEDELVRAVGAHAVEQLIAQEGELASLRSLQQQPAHRDRPVEQQLRRFFGSHSGRKALYAPLLVQALPPAAMPAPLRDVVRTVS